MGIMANDRMFTKRYSEKKSWLGRSARRALRGTCRLITARLVGNRCAGLAACGACVLRQFVCDTWRMSPVCSMFSVIPRASLAGGVYVPFVNLLHPYGYLEESFPDGSTICDAMRLVAAFPP
jgi:hypothetical protein